MKFKYHLSLATLMLPLLGYAQTDLYVQDLNYMPKRGAIAYQGTLTSETNTTERRILDVGVIAHIEEEENEASTRHILAFGLSDSLSVFAETSYAFSNKSEVKEATVNGTELDISESISNKGLKYVGVGLNWRFLEQNADKVNADLRFTTSSGLQKAQRGSFYDSDNDGNSDKTIDGNSAQAAHDYTLTLAGGKKFEQFEIRGEISFLYSQKGSFSSLRSNSDGSDLKVHQDAYSGIAYKVGGQLRLNNNFFIYGNFIQTVVTKVKTSSTEANGDKSESEMQPVFNLGIDLGAKVALIPNKFFAFGELHGDATAERKIENTTNGQADNISDKMTKDTTGRITVGLLASF